MEPLTDLFLHVHSAVGQGLFLAVSILLSALLCVFLIPRTAGLMVNNVAGLSERYFGKKSRALVINASTNNPEAFAMIISLAMGRMGGWTNPLGSLLANCYLMYGVALVWVFFKMRMAGRREGVRGFFGLLYRERRLVLWHVSLSLLLFGVGAVALRMMAGGGGSDGEPSATPAVGSSLYAAMALLLLALLFFRWLEGRLKRERPELFTDIHSGDQRESFVGLFLGTAGLIACCWVMNSLFLAWTELYQGSLERVLGTQVFAGLHYFLGALITSLPELKVAIDNYSRISSPDLNTALGAASYSNLVNVALALLGLLVFAGLHLSGTTLPW